MHSFPFHEYNLFTLLPLTAPRLSDCYLELLWLNVIAMKISHYAHYLADAKVTADCNYAKRTLLGFL